MSRRTKLIILALFLVLLAIPAAYVALTWHPQNPLHFHLERIHQASELDHKGGRRLRIRVENSSHAEIHLFKVLMEEQGNSPDWVDHSGFINAESQREQGIQVQEHAIIIPPRSTIHLTGYLRPELLSSAQQGRIAAHYYWNSQIIRKSERGMRWFNQHSPRMLRNLIFLPEYLVDEAPLESAPGVEIPPTPPPPATTPTRE
ncbi:hypothetical protein [Roseimicrobium sp. ORNL1]|uniref:hypothetical protein n=1 Tax=Roseimicrobium sp. ORNL1 TaxID=2711231 RepID=UPI0013E19359|nr:hypothetical protein [Roseimicrobium sp. ORNL1]QIF01954.1 hypothetical protein G5S37_10575 [Roseimicrobium sp. ORNL1]